MSDKQEDQMSPDASPGEVTKKAGVRRVNNMPMYIVGALMGVFLLVMVLVASDRAAKQHQAPEAKAEKAGSTQMFAKEIAGDRQDGIIPPKAAAPLAVPGDLAPPGSPSAAASAPGGGVPPGAVAVARPGNLDTPPAPPNSAGNQRLNPPGQNGPSDDERNRIRMMKLQQFDEAVKAKTSINATAPRSSNNYAGSNGAPGSREETIAKLAAVRQQIQAATSDDPTAQYKKILAMAQSNGLMGSGGSGAGSGSGPQLMQTAASTSNNGNSMGQFNGQGDRWKLDSQVEAPRSPYELRAGFVVPATLISGINSELPGQIIGQVAQNVFDTATGKYLLIPQGSRLVGQYASNVQYGQARVLVAWQRIIFPDGKAMDIGAMPGSDSAGYAGFNDQVNNHYFRIFGSAFLMSGVIAGVSLSQPQQNGNSAPTASSAMSQALGQELGQVTAQMIAKNLNIAPTLEIRPGYRFNVMVTKDMTFSKPYQSFDY
ncbi:MAG: conjugal transfer protein TrbI [Rhodoferax ferrireducens]|jgi:type IV secretory pathway VirB10-like protein|uniref:Conjugal transfer protein TrbI n=1 Tax=Rhodoferax ferrireducens TaxID=192843 RepID=A0A1W9KQ70_9BURK|nr:MAG: conjugal transfer protein TrbI [Rhodoferax ferrireducens]